MHATITFCGGTKTQSAHVMAILGRTAITSFGTFTWDGTAWRWVRDHEITIDLPDPAHTRRD